MDKHPLLVQIINKAKQQQHENNNKTKDKPFVPLAKSTINIYVANINKLYRTTESNETLESLEWLTERSKIKSFVNSLNSTNTRKNYLSAILTLLNYDRERFKSELAFYTDIAQGNYENITVEKKHDNKTIVEKVVTLQQFDDFLSTLSKDHCLKKEYLLFLFLRYFPIRNEIATLIYITASDFNKLDKETKLSNNYIVEMSQTKKFKVIRSKYKTSNIFGTIQFEIVSNPLKNTIKNYVRYNEIASNSPLFMYHDKQMTENQVSQRLSYVSEHSSLAVKLSTSSIFKIIVSDYFNNTKDTIDEQKRFLKRFSLIRGTKLSTLVDYYIYKKDDDTSSIKSE